MKCPKCGHELPAGATSCPDCSGSAAHDPRHSGRLRRFDAGGAPPAAKAAQPPRVMPAQGVPAGPSAPTVVRPSRPASVAPAAPPAPAALAEPNYAAGVRLPGETPTDPLVARLAAASSPEPPEAEPAEAPPPQHSGRPPITLPERLGPYRVESLIGRGGMGAVLRGFDERLNRAVAIKVLAPEHSQSSEFVRRFLDEARAVAKVAHPNVVTVHFAGSDGDRHFFAMELVEGESLQQLVERDGPLGAKRAVGYALQAARGLAAAFAEGLIHRDVKPGNLMLTPEDVVKVADFGLAKMTTGLGTVHGEIMGSPKYMSPEQGSGLKVDHRSDIYSLGATLFFLLTGTSPFDAEDIVGMIYKHVHSPAPKVPHAPYGLDRLLQMMLAKSPDERPADYERLTRELEKLEQRGVAAGVLVPAGWKPEEAPPARESSGPLAHEAPTKGDSTKLREQKAKVERLLKALGELLEQANR